MDEFSALPLGISSGTITAAPLSPRTYQLAQAHGVRAIEIGYEHTGPALVEAASWQSLAAATRLAQPPIWSVHLPYQPQRDLSALDEDQRRTAAEHAVQGLQLARDLGAGLAVLHASQDPIVPGSRGTRLDRARASLEELTRAARARHLRLAVETMPPQWLPAGLDEAHFLVDHLDPTVTGYCLDPNHANLTGDLGSIIKGLGPRMWSVHLSDNDGLEQRHWMPGQGIIDWPAFIAALQAANYRGPLIYELDPHPEGAEECLREIGANYQALFQQ
ncbi:MAG: TIM barrel protein [Candidatus Latescibacteria bacterium]|nr:TIM barrel protein [Candidatus Latescibacterota bacterium]